MRVGEEDFADMRVPEKFWETHANCFESAAGGDDDADGHGVGLSLRGRFFARGGGLSRQELRLECGKVGLAGCVGLADVGE